MRILLVCLFFCVAAFGQDLETVRRIETFKACEDLPCQLAQSIRMAEWYVETDHMDKSQEWLNYAKKLNQMHPNDSIAYFISSLQAETFYYVELYQFGIHEAEKGIEKAQALHNDLFLADAYFFKGIIEIERNEMPLAEKDLWKALKLHPGDDGKHLRTMIGKAYIYNNIGQVKLKLKQLDSAQFYNNKAYALAQKNQNYRGIVNGEQTMGLLFAERKKLDSARYYLSRSINSALQYELHDVAMLNHAYLMKFYLDEPQKVRENYEAGLQLLKNYEINNSYERYFYQTALEVYVALADTKKMLLLQDKIIKLNKETTARSSRYVQHIVEQYMNNENKLLQSRINELDQARDITVLQLLAALFGFLILLFVAVFFRRKNKLQQSLLEQKNEISQDLHDDIGSELSSILIHANLLSKLETEPKQQMLVYKISHSSSEISQRLNAFIWSLNDEHNTVGRFCEYLKQYAGNLTEAGNVALHFSQSYYDVSQPLNGYIRKHLLFCVKEALNNSLKHAQGSHILLDIKADEKQLQITIQDDGKGLQRSSDLGNGLQNMRKRMAQLKGTITLTNDAGLKVLLQIPMR